MQRFREIQRIGRCLLDDAQRHGGTALEAHRTALGSGANFDPGDVIDPHRVTIDGLDDDAAELFDSLQIRIGHHRKLTLSALDAPSRHFHILLAQGIFNIGRGQLVGSQALAIEPDPHGELAVTEDPHIGSTGQGLQARLDDAAGDIGDFQRRMFVGGKSDPDDGIGVCLNFGDHRFIDRIRQFVAHARNAVTHISRG